TRLILDALGSAAADPAGVPLFGSRAAPGLFAATAAARQAAQRCKDEDYVRVVRSATRGKTVQEVFAITENGLAYLLSQVSSKQVLEDLVRALDARQAQVGELVAAARHTQESFEALRVTAQKVLQQLQQRGAENARLPCDQTTASSNGADT